MVTRTNVPPALDDDDAHIDRAQPTILNPAQSALRAFAQTPNEETLGRLQRQSITWNPLGKGTWDEAAKARCTEFLQGLKADGSNLTVLSMLHAGLTFDFDALAEDSPQGEALLRTPLCKLDADQRDALLDVISPKASFVAAVIDSGLGNIPDHLLSGRGY